MFGGAGLQQNLPKGGMADAQVSALDYWRVLRCTDRFYKQTREMCGRRSHEEAAALGYPSIAALAHALNVWVTFHQWSLRTIVEASAHTAQGIDSPREPARDGVRGRAARTESW